MTAPQKTDWAGVVKNYLNSDNYQDTYEASNLLADLFEEVGDNDTAKTIRGEMVIGYIIPSDHLVKEHLRECEIVGDHGSLLDQINWLLDNEYARSFRSPLERGIYAMAIDDCIQNSDTSYHSAVLFEEREGALEMMMDITGLNKPSVPTDDPEEFEESELDH